MNVPLGSQRYNCFHASLASGRVEATQVRFPCLAVGVLCGDVSQSKSERVTRSGKR
jgi:hypothetical protein